MIDKIFGRVAEAGTLRAIYQSIASLFALAAIGTWLGLAEPTLADSDVGDGNLTALGRTPLAVTYRALGAFRIPRDWVVTVGNYLADLGGVEIVIHVVAVLLAMAVTLTLNPNGNFPSLQASTWWICAAIVTQLGGFPWILLVFIVATGLIVALFYSKRLEPIVWLIQLGSAPLYIPIQSLRLIFDRHRAIRTETLST